MPDWFRRRLAPEREARNAAIPAGVATKCEKCGELLVTRDFERDLKVCARCGHHHKLTADERIAITADSGSFCERDAHLIADDHLQFPDYAAKLEKSQQTTQRNDGLVWGTAAIAGHACVLALVDFRFIGGTMGSVFGEKFVRASEHATQHKLPVVVFCASGGARMQEGLLALMQMAKTGMAVAQLAEAKVPYVVVMTDPTTGGALASFASLGDVTLAESHAYIAFAGARVAQQAQTHKPPGNYQSAEFQQEHGMIDRVVPRKEMQATLARLIALLGSGTDRDEAGAPSESPISVPATPPKTPALRNGKSVS